MPLKKTLFITFLLALVTAMTADAQFSRLSIGKYGIQSISPDGFTAADVNGDEKLSIQDATNIQKYAANYDLPYEIGKAV